MFTLTYRHAINTYEGTLTLAGKPKSEIVFWSPVSDGIQYRLSPLGVAVCLRKIPTRQRCVIRNLTWLNSYTLPNFGNVEKDTASYLSKNVKMGKP